MPESVYKVIELVGTSPTSWEKAAQAAIKAASKSLRDLRVAEVGQLDMHLEDGRIIAYRAKVKVSFKYESEGGNSRPEAPAPAAPATPVSPPARKAAKRKKARRKKG